MSTATIEVKTTTLATIYLSNRANTKRKREEERRREPLKIIFLKS